MNTKLLFPTKDKTDNCLLGRPIISTSDIPVCGSCDSKMNFIFSLKTDEGISLVFLCQADPGMCDDWDADSGDNAVLNYKSIEIESCSNYLINDSSLPQEQSVGKLGGTPDWIQGDETPNCDCDKAMTFVAQVEESAHPDLNFGGHGSSYVFTCAPCNKSKFLWQS